MSTSKQALHFSCPLCNTDRPAQLHKPRLFEDSYVQ